MTTIIILIVILIVALNAIAFNATISIKATVKVNSQNDWQSVLDSLIEFVKGKGLGETQNLQIMFDAQPA